MEQITAKELSAQELRIVLKRVFPIDSSFISSRKTKTREIIRPQGTLLFRLDLFPYYTHILLNILIESFDTESDRDSNPNYTKSNPNTIALIETHTQISASEDSSSLKLPLLIPLFSLCVKTWSIERWEKIK
jgi:hypothetical protein